MRVAAIDATIVVGVAALSSSSSEHQPCACQSWLQYFRGNLINLHDGDGVVLVGCLLAHWFLLYCGRMRIF